jgi:hypothetical protein
VKKPVKLQNESTFGNAIFYFIATSFGETKRALIKQLVLRVKNRNAKTLSMITSNWHENCFFVLFCYSANVVNRFKIL